MVLFRAGPGRTIEERQHGLPYLVPPMASRLGQGVTLRGVSAERASVARKPNQPARAHRPSVPSRRIGASSRQYPEPPRWLVAATSSGLIVFCQEHISWKSVAKVLAKVGAILGTIYVSVRWYFGI